MNGRLFPLPIVLPLLLSLAGCEEPEFRPPPPPTVVVGTPLVKDVTHHLVLGARSEPYETVEVPARVEGVLLEIAHEEGLLVEEGDLMFRIDPAPFAAARDAAAAQVAAAEAEAELAGVTATRLRKAYEENAISELQALEAEAREDVAKENVEVAKKTLAIRELELSYTDVYAPISGRAEHSDAYVGSLVGHLGAGPLTRVVDDSRVRVWFTVPDRVMLTFADKDRREGGGPPDLETLPDVELQREVDAGFPYTGRIDYIDPEVDVETGTLRVRAVFDNPDRSLVGGLFVRVRLSLDVLADALVVPEEAVGRDQQGRYLYVVGEGDVVERRAVELGPRTEGGIVATSGVSAGERVIVAGLLSARPGAKVTPQPAGEPGS